jgi:hypothetical protein
VAALTESETKAVIAMLALAVDRLDAAVARLQRTLTEIRADRGNLADQVDRLDARIDAMRTPGQ